MRVSSTAVTGFGKKNAASVIASVGLIALVLWMAHLSVREVRATSELAPVIFVAGAITAAGYGTLVNSSYPPLRSIGIVSLVSVIALAAASVLVLPALLQTGRRPRP